MTENGTQHNESLTRRAVLRSIAGVGIAGVGGHFTEWGDLVAVNVGYRETDGYDVTNEMASSVARTYDFDAVTITIPEKAIQQLADHDAIRYVERVRTMAAFGQTVPWGVDRVGGDTVHNEGGTGNGVDIAIIDSGIDSSHPDLRANVGEGASFTSSFLGLFNKKGNDTKRSRPDHRAYRSQRRDWDFFASGSAWEDDNGHGTHCAGIAGAVDNAQGVVGVAPESTLHAVKVLDKKGVGTTSDIASGIEHVGRKGWDVGSMSFGAVKGSSLVRDACSYTTEQGTLLIAAAGNSGPCTDCVGYPAAYSGVVGVGATTQSDQLAEFSATGPEIDLVAPGVGIKSTYLTSKQPYLTAAGTSLSCPHVAGAGALLVAQGYSNSDATARLTETAEDIGLSKADGGAGLLDVPAALGV